jgi:hypothetical protein
MEDVIPLIASFGAYTAIIRTCKRYHWLPEDDSSFQSVYTTFGRYRLPHPDKVFHTPCTYYTSVVIWNTNQSLVNTPFLMGSKFITYKLHCLFTYDPEYDVYNETEYEHDGLRIMLLGLIDCCNGNIKKCRHAHPELLQALSGYRRVGIN